MHDEIDCGRRCLSRDGCISYNYQYKVNNTKQPTCELSSQTKESKPEAFTVKMGFQYFGSLHAREVMYQLLDLTSFYISLKVRVPLLIYTGRHISYCRYSNR